jgi:sortase (surface protein transpeptidase)
MHQSPEATTRAGGGRRGSFWQTAALLLVAVLAIAGGGFLLAALSIEPPRPPQPSADVAPPGFDPAVTTPRRQQDTEPVAMAPSRPVRIRIPTIDVDAKTMQLGVDENNEVEVPPLAKADQAGWYKYGPTPGELGNAVIIGHVDSHKIGPAVFFYLGDLEPGDTIEVKRTDGSVAEFEVDGVDTFPKKGFPHELLYGPADAAQLRLVTCGGEFDRKRREYLDNVVVFATLVT